MSVTLTESPINRRTELTKNLLSRYERMLEIRMVEDRILGLFADGHVDGTTHTCQGQEAVAVGVAAALNPDDTVACTYRGHGHALALGLQPESLIAEVLGRVTGCTGGMGGSMHLSDLEVGLLPTFGIVGAGIPVAVGAALSAQTRGTNQVAAAICGDGATNIGAFHEGLNMAAVWRLPAVFIVENNIYGEYSRIDRTTPVEDLAVRATAYAMPSAIVDGQDVEAVESAVAEAVARARNGGGPTLVEMKTYRYVGHSRSDPATYRLPGELEEWRKRDPLTVTAQRLIDSGESTAEALATLKHDLEQELEEAVGRALAAPKPTRWAMFDHVSVQAEV